MSGAPTPSDRPPPLEGFLGLRSSLRASPVGEGGNAACRALSAAMDGAVRDLADGLPSPSLAVVAVGGYGRAELSPYSDIDLMVLHDREDPAEAAAAIFRPLWDAGLRLGHSVRTVDEAARAARERFDTFTTLLTSRLVAGDEELFDLLLAEVGTVIRARPLRRYLVGEELERRRRDPYLAMAVDVKAGRGGLRTLHGFEWERRREALIGRFSPQPAPAEEAARETLLRVRNALHATSGRPQDIFTHELREQVARWLGEDAFGIARELVEAMHTVDSLADLRWPEVTRPTRSLTRRAWNRVRGRGGSRPSEGTPTAADIMDLLRSGQEGRTVLERMLRDGHLQAVLPEWEEARLTPQLAPFHEHPLAAHLWRAVDEMWELIDGDDAHYAAIAAEVGSVDALVLAAFLHDIGKGRGGDHSSVGAEIASRFCRRIGCPPDVTELVERAVAYHLLLSETATRRDLDDPVVIDEVVEKVGSLRLLQVLYLLTVADSRATGSSMWSDWKSVLVRTLFLRCAARFGARHPDMADGAGEASDREVADHPLLEAHLEGMPVEYVRSTSPREVVWHLELIDELDSHCRLGVRDGEVAATAVVVGEDRRGFHRIVAETFAANGIDVLEARLASRRDGVVVDRFLVRDDRTAGPIPTDRWDGVRRDLEAALAGDLDSGSKVAARAEAYAAVAPSALPPRVRVMLDERDGDGVVTVRCSDRIGRLAEVLSILQDCDMDIRLAKIDSRGGEVVDTFHIRGLSRPERIEDLSRLESRIAAAIAS
ncbi:MAG: HD domain-containing protein [Actinomycetota bacterium]